MRSSSIAVIRPPPAPGFRDFRVRPGRSWVVLRGPVVIVDLDAEGACAVTDRRLVTRLPPGPCDRLFPFGINVVTAVTLVTRIPGSGLLDVVDGLVFLL